MPEPDPYASPFHPVVLPGEPAAPPPGPAGYPLPMPEAAPDAAARSRPTALTVASWCWLAGALLVVVGLPAVFYTDGDAFAERLYQDSLGTPQPNTRTEAQIGARLTPVVFGLGFAVLSAPYLLGALKLRSGRNWARVLLAVLAAPALLCGLALLTAFGTGAMPFANWLVGAVWALLFLAAVLLGTSAMFLPPSNDYVRWVTYR
ncbi:hypothetical protein AB0I60_08635 [Actinosynnema sp. NPDC050436]|uniref:hypothetical protein n=1 Tax=Actinosynnema sp. NPDC050436 TaxID=3155659 RepID=UPI0033D71F4E